MQKQKSQHFLPLIFPFILPHRVRDGKLRKNAVDIRQAMVGMVVVFSLLPKDPHLHLRPDNAAFFALFSSKDHIRNPNSIQFFNKNRRVRVQLQQGGGQHIPGGVHAAIQV